MLELMIDQLVGFFVVELVQPGSKSSTWHECLYFSGCILRFNGAMLSSVFQ